jgi:hypothetical protein
MTATVTDIARSKCKTDTALVEDLFNERPIKIGGFALRAKEAIPLVIRPTLEGWTDAFQLASAAVDASPYWVGDLLAYSESRADWQYRIDQAVAVTKLSRRTLQNQTTTCRKVKGRARELAPSISHAAVVEGLAPAHQERLLEQARDEDLTVPELAGVVKKHNTPLRGQAAGVHDVIVSVCVSLEANTGTAAERLAWDAVKPYLKSMKADQPVLSARITGAKAQPK